MNRIFLILGIFFLLSLSGCLTDPDIVLVRTSGGSGSDTNKVAVSATDTNPNYLFNKLQQGPGITITKQNAGGDENILISAIGGGSGGRTYTSGTPATIEVNNDLNTISQNFDGNFWSRFTPANDGNFYTRFQTSFDGNFITHINALDLNNSLNYSKVNCDQNTSCVFTGKITTTRDANFNNIKFNGTLSGGDFNYSLNDANGTQSCPGGQALQTVGSSVVCVSFSSGTGRTYTSGTPDTIEVNNDLNTISQNFDGNFWARFTPANDGNFYTRFQSNFDSNFWSRFTPANDGNFYVRFQTNFDSNFWVRFTPAYDGNFWLRFTPAYDGNFWSRFTPANDGNFYTRFKPNFDSNFNASFDSNFWSRFGPSFDSNFWSRFTPANDGNFWIKFTAAYDGNFWSRFGPAYDGNFWSRFTPAYDGNFWSRFTPSFDGNFWSRFTPAYDGNFWSRFTPANDGNFYTRFKPNFDSNFYFRNAGDMNWVTFNTYVNPNGAGIPDENILNASLYKRSCDNNTSCLLTGTITTTLLATFNEIKFNGTLSGGDFNYSLQDSNDSFTCSAGQAINKIGGGNFTCVSVTGSDSNKVAMSNLDTNPNYLTNKILPGAYMSKSISNPLGGDQVMTLSASTCDKNTSCIIPASDINWDTNSTLDTRYVKKVGDTMSGALVITDVNNSSQAFAVQDVNFNVGLEVDLRQSPHAVLTAELFPFVSNVSQLGSNTYRWLRGYITDLNIFNKLYVTNDVNIGRDLNVQRFTHLAFDVNTDKNVFVGGSLYGQVFGAQVAAGTSCNTECNAFDGFPGGSDWTCIKATTLGGVNLTCAQNLAAADCMCKN